MNSTQQTNDLLLAFSSVLCQDHNDNDEQKKKTGKDVVERLTAAGVDETEASDAANLLFDIYVHFQKGEAEAAEGSIEAATGADWKNAGYSLDLGPATAMLRQHFVGDTSESTESTSSVVKIDPNLIPKQPKGMEDEKWELILDLLADHPTASVEDQKANHEVLRKILDETTLSKFVSRGYPGADVELQLRESVAAPEVESKVSGRAAALIKKATKANGDDYNSCMISLSDEAKKAGMSAWKLLEQAIKEGVEGAFELKKRILDEHAALEAAKLDSEQTTTVETESATAAATTSSESSESESSEDADDSEDASDSSPSSKSWKFSGRQTALLVAAGGLICVGIGLWLGSDSKESASDAVASQEANVSGSSSPASQPEVEDKKQQPPQFAVNPGAKQAPPQLTVDLAGAQSDESKPKGWGKLSSDLTDIGVPGWVDLSKMTPKQLAVLAYHKEYSFLAAAAVWREAAIKHGGSDADVVRNAHSLKASVWEDLADRIRSVVFHNQMCPYSNQEIQSEFNLIMEDLGVKWDSEGVTAPEETLVGIRAIVSEYSKYYGD